MISFLTNFNDHVRKLLVFIHQISYLICMSDHATYYKAIQSRDKRFDGKFFVGVTTTGIYCRPICPAPCPKPENVQFYQSAAAARDAGFRPCFRCHPESAPNSYEWEGSPQLLSSALKLIMDGYLDHASVENLAGLLNISPRHLRRLFSEYLGTNPLAVAQTRRLHLAKKLLHETNLSISRVSQAAGFSSIRALNNIFRLTFNKTPTEIRKKSFVKTNENLLLQLFFRPPYDWGAIVAYFKAHAIPGLESVTASSYTRLVRFADQVGEISVTHLLEKSALQVKISSNLSPFLTQIVSRTRRLFDLEADPMAVNQVLSQDPFLAGLVKTNPGLRVAGAWDEFELAVRAILNQQIGRTSALSVLKTLTLEFGRMVENSETPGLTHLFPQSTDLVTADLNRIGLSGATEKIIQAIAQDLLDNGSWQTRFLDLDSAVGGLVALFEIKPSTAHNIAMQALDFPDAFPFADQSLRRALSLDPSELISKKSLLQRVEQFRPWRAYAAAHIWNITSQEIQ